MQFKRQIFRITVYLVSLFLVITLLSETICRLSWAEVCISPITSGELDRSVSYSTIIVPPREDISGASMGENGAAPDELTAKLRQGVYLSMSFDELELIKKYEVFGEVTVSSLTTTSTRPLTISAKLTYVDFTYNNGTGKFDVYFIVDPKISVSPGFPIRVVFHPKTVVEFMKLVPADSVFPENTDIERYYIYTVTEKWSMWGKANYVEKLEVQVLAQDYQYTAITFVDSSVPVPEMIACSPSKTLHDGDRVLVTGA